MDTNNLLHQTIDHIFSQSETSLRKPPQVKSKKRRAKQSELELALTVILVDLASSDQNFEQREYLVISSGLRRLFGDSKDMRMLVNRAQLALSNLRGTQSFAEILKENLSEDERKVVADIIEEVIGADGIEDGFEIYLRNKYAKLLDIPADPIPAQEKAPNS